MPRRRRRAIRDLEHAVTLIGAEDEIEAVRSLWRATRPFSGHSSFTDGDGRGIQRRFIVAGF